jgi:hypothetical protein
MGSTIQMFTAGIALVVNTFLIIIMTWMSNLILAPIMGAFSKIITSPQAVPMSDMTYITQVIWVILILMEIVCVISFIVVASRNNEVSYETYY